MTSDRDPTTRIVRLWLEDGATTLPDRVLERVLTNLPATPQHRAYRPVWRIPSMPNAFKAAFTAAVLVAVVATGVLIRSPRAGVGGALEQVSPSPVVCQSRAPDASPNPSPLPQLNDQPTLDAGRYMMNGSPAVGITVSVPAGWSGSDWVARGPKGNDQPDGMAIRFYTVDSLYKNPVSPGEGLLPVGPTVDDLVAAILSDPAWTAAGPTNISIDGCAGQLVQLTIPSDVHLGTDGNFYLSVDASGGRVWGDPGMTFDQNIIDVGGERLVVEAFHYPGTSEDDLAAQRAVVDSIQFNRVP